MRVPGALGVVFEAIDGERCLASHEPRRIERVDGHVEQQHILRGENTRKVYRLGDKITVQVVRVDMERRQIDLGVAEILEAVRRDERPRGAIRSKTKPKREQKKRAQRPGKRERQARRGKSGRR